MRFYADLHIHSRYSRACSRDCDLEHLAWWAGRKGIDVVGTGDFTHPAWADELRGNLVPAEPGLFRLLPDLERSVLERLPSACRTPARFMLSSEISTIYKRDGRTRKVHHLLYAPSLEAVEAITKSLAKVGNLASDGRPILGLDSRDLLEITLEGGGYLIPAHAWTPWFAVLGSQSGFDRVSDCYADLASHIFAIETGLSSDPEMNWRVSSLDGYRLVSNSDAHSPPMLGREATLFGTDLDYFAIERALRTGDGFGGTVEFFPEEGKYHLDGHRACDVRTTPSQTREAGGKCPVCGKPPTVGVQHRVEALADRPEGFALPGAAGFRSFVPLPEIIGEIAGVGPKSKSVTAQVTAMVERFGPELSILGEVPLDELAAKAPSTVAEAIARLRRGEVRREAGYDGVYGTIRLFEPGELAGRGSGALFELPSRRSTEPKRGARPRQASAGGGAGDAGAADEALSANVAAGADRAGGTSDGGTAAGPAAAGPAGDGFASGDGLDAEQRAVVTAAPGPLLIVAGPGAGKTRVLTHMIAHRISSLGVEPERCLAVTFTRRAAAELRERLGGLLPPEAAGRVTVATFHGLGLLIVREQCKRLGLDAEPRVADEGTRLAVLRLAGGDGLPRRAADVVGHAKRTRAAAAVPLTGESVAGGECADSAMAEEVAIAALAERYDAALRERGLVDLDDLITLPVTMLAGDTALAASYRERWTDVFVDEYQDVDGLQYRLLRLLTAAGPGSAARPAGPAEPGGMAEPEGVAEPGGPVEPGGPAASSVTAIGDPDQAIYGFRGGDVGYFLRFRSDYAGAREARLTRSYRSAPTVVTSAMQLIRPGTLVPGRSLVPARTDIPDSPVILRRHADERDEASFVAETIEKMLGGASFHALDSRAVDARERTEHQLSFSDFAILYRTSSQALPAAEALAKRGFPVQQRSHSRLAEAPGVAEIVAALRGGTGVLEPDAPPAVADRLREATELALSSLALSSAALPDAAGARRPPVPASSVPAGGAAGAAVADAGAGMDAGSPGMPAGRRPGEAELAARAKTAGLALAIRNAAGLLAPLAVRCGSDLDRFLDELALGAEVDTWDPRADRISLLTLHASKGLEFPVVFIVGCDDGLLPLRPWGAAGIDYAEERRLFFVGGKGATPRLVLSGGDLRTLRGTVTACPPSPYLASIDPALLDQGDGAGGAASRRKRRDAPQQLRLL